MAKSIGTTFYRLNLQDTLNTLDSTHGNIILLHQLNEWGWTGLNLDKMYGSLLDGDTLYICVTDGQEIEVDGEYVEPEYAIEDFGLDDIADYIEDGDKDIIRRYITPYEIDDKKLDLEGTVIDLLEDDYPLSEVLKALDDMGILDDLV